MERRDSRLRYPSAMEEYLGEYGRHFNRSLFEFATGMMKDRNGNALKAWDKEKVDQVLRANNVTVKNNHGHDAAYVANMARADYWGSALFDESHLALFVRDYLDDPDGAESRAFDEFYVKTVALGIPIFWEELL